MDSLCVDLRCFLSFRSITQIEMVGWLCVCVCDLSGLILSHSLKTSSQAFQEIDEFDKPKQMLQPTIETCSVLTARRIR